jgi:S-adenosylmethionine/arginine decarboxylase-like enzyme
MNHLTTRHAMGKLLKGIEDQWPCLEELHNKMMQAAWNQKMQTIDKCKHEFYPQGCSIMLILNEGKIAAHAWPEHNLMLVDCFTHEQDKQPGKFIEDLGQLLGAEVVDLKTVERVV